MVADLEFYPGDSTPMETSEANEALQEAVDEFPEVQAAVVAAQRGRDGAARIEGGRSLSFICVQRLSLGPSHFNF